MGDQDFWGFTSINAKLKNKDIDEKMARDLEC